MKKILIASTLALALSACGNSEPPIYESGMSKREYGEKFGAWLGDKLASSNEAEIESYREKTTELVEEFQKSTKSINDKKELVLLVDSLIKEVVALSEDRFDLAIEDWRFIIDPQVDESASKQSQAELKYGISQIMAMLNIGYHPAKLSSVIESSLKNKSGGEIYYHVIKNSKYPKVIANDAWVIDFESKKSIINLAVKTAEQESLNFNLAIDGFGRLKSSQDKIEEIKYDYKFDLIDSHEVVGYNRDNRTIFEFKEIFESKSKEDYEKVFNELAYAKRDLESAEKYLAEKREYLRNNPDTSWAKTDVKKYEEKVAKYTQSLKEAKELFEQVYNNDVDRLNSRIVELKELEESSEQSFAQYQQNIRIFLKTYNEAKALGFDNHTIGKVLFNGRQVYDSGEYNVDGDIKLDHTDGMAFSDYMETMNTLINNAKF